MAKNLFVWLWSPILMLLIGVVGNLAEWENWLTLGLMSAVMLIGIAVAIITAQERANEKISDRIRQVSGYFTRRFGGESSYSVFAIIRELFRTKDPELWEYAHACEQTERVYNTWCENYISRIETDSATGRFAIYIRRYLQELWMLNSLYHEYIEQLRDIAEKVELPTEMIEQYNRFSAEYNSFTNSFRELINLAVKSGKTELDANSVKDAIFVGSMAYTVPGLNTTPQPINYNYTVTQPQNMPPTSFNHSAPSMANYAIGVPAHQTKENKENAYKREYGGESYREEEPKIAARPPRSDPREEYEAMRRANYEKRNRIPTKVSTDKTNDIPGEDEYSSIATTQNTFSRDRDDSEYRKFTY
ncbi:MAG: hypothetical protein FWF37_02230 [Chloroflexi bacterium]|nr:hypothetical protein [Chloroflexota bacterium]